MVNSDAARTSVSEMQEGSVELPSLPAANLLLATVPVEIAAVPVEIAAIAVDISVVPVQVTLAGPDLGTLARCSAIVPIAKITAQLPAIIFDGSPVAGNVTVVVANVLTVAVAVTPSILRHSRPDTENAHQESTNKNAFHDFCFLQGCYLRPGNRNPAWRRSRLRKVKQRDFGVYLERERESPTRLENVRNYAWLRPRNTRGGKKMMALINSRTPFTAMPTMRKGNSNSHTTGYSTRASSARGQQTRRSRHHT